MIQTLVEIVIYVAAAVAGVGGVACLVYLVSLVLWERHQQRAYLDDYRRENAARRAGFALEHESALSRRSRTPAPYPSASASVRHHAGRLAGVPDPDLHARPMAALRRDQRLSRVTPP